MATKKTPSKPVGAYRPPGARGTATPLAFMREDKGGAAFVRDSPSSFSGSVNGFGKGRSRGVPGADPVEDKSNQTPGATPGAETPSGTTEGADGEPLSKTAKKNAKKREAKKQAAKDGEPEVQRAPAPAFPPGLAVPTGPKSTKTPPGGRRATNPQQNGVPTRPAPQKQAPTPAPAPVVEIPQPASPAPAEETGQEKKVRGLLKKIRAIEDLKMRHAGGEKLEDTQMKKIHSEEGVRKELSGLGYTG